MIRLLHRRSNSARSELEEVRRILCRLKVAPAQTRHAVGAGVCLANSDFMGQFGGIQPFRQIPPADREQYYSRLSDLEETLRGQELGMALGVGLYRIWLVNWLAGRRDAAELLGEELTELSRRAANSEPSVHRG